MPEELAEDQQIQWIEDGHVLHFRLDRDDIYISHVACPFRENVSLCNRMRENCVVDTYIGVYGAECNLGGVTLEGPVEIAWVPVLGESDLDREFAQIWFIPKEDPDYIALKLLGNK